VSRTPWSSRPPAAGRSPWPPRPPWWPERGRVDSCPAPHLSSTKQGTRMAITTNDLKNGMTLKLSEGLFQVVEFQHVKPGKGGAFVRTTMRNVRTGYSLDRTFRAGEKVEQAMI